MEIFVITSLEQWDAWVALLDSDTPQEDKPRLRALLTQPTVFDPPAESL